MTTKQKAIIGYLTEQKGQAYLIDIRDSIAMEFEDADDFENTMKELVTLNLIYENEYGDTLYKLSDRP